MKIEYAADSQEDLTGKGPIAVTLTAHTPEERLALGRLVEHCIAAFNPEPEVESDSREIRDADSTTH
jgi:hypothetical protein